MRALILSPTQELARQTLREVLKLAAGAQTDGSVVVECYQKYNARPSLRLVISESDYVRLHGVLRAREGRAREGAGVG